MIITCNKLAMTALATESFRECHQYLRRAEDLVRATKQKMLLTSGRGGAPTEQVTKLYSLTMNNMGCYYKKYVCCLLNGCRI
jgi:flagellin-specific chaperone FliS